MNESKSILVSKTFWVNALMLSASVVACVAGSDVVAEYPQVIAALGAVGGLVNIALRFLTSKAIA